LREVERAVEATGELRDVDVETAAIESQMIIASYRELT